MSCGDTTTTITTDLIVFLSIIFGMPTMCIAGVWLLRERNQ